MGHDDHGHLLLRQFPDDLQDFPRQLRIQRGSRLVKEQDLRVHCQCPGNGNTLLLSAGQLVGIGVCLVRQAHLFQQGQGFLPYFLFLPFLHQHRRFHHVFQHRVVREQVEVLEYQTKHPPDLLQLRLRPVNGFSVHVPCGIVAQVDQVPAVHGFQQCRAAQQRGFAAAAGADNGQYLTLLHGNAQVCQDLCCAELFPAVINLKKLAHILSRFILNYL